MSETVTLADVERLCWSLSGWKVEQRDVDRLLAAVTAYAGYGPDEAVMDAPAQEPEEAAERPAEPLVADQAPQGTPDTLSGAQGGVQRLHVTGTLTLVCTGAHPPAALPPRAPSGRFIPLPRAGEVTGYRVCGKCHQSRPVEDFSRDAKGNGGRRYACRDCENTRKRESRRAKRQAA